MLQVSLLVMNRLMCGLVSDNGTCLLHVISSSLFNCRQNTLFAKLGGQFVPKYASIILKIGKN